MLGWLRWSKTRLLITLGIAYVLFAEATSLLFSDGATCIVNPAAGYGRYYADNNECPALHIFLIKLATTVFEKLGDPNNVTMLATIAIAAFTGTLWWSTDKLRQAGDKQIRAMRAIALRQDVRTQTSLAAVAEANELNRQNFDGVHRPKIRIKHVFLTSEIWAGESLRVQIVFVNIGISPAQLVDWGVGASVVREGRFLEPRPIYPGPPFFLTGVLPSGTSLETGSENTGYVFRDFENVGIRDGAGKLYCYGYVHYRDGLNNLRTTAFCRILERPANPSVDAERWRFIKVDNPDYEYED